MGDTHALHPNEEAIQALAEKLSSFVATLEPAEADALTALLRRPIVGEDDVTGYGWWDLKTSSGWANFLSSALLGVVMSEGVILDQHVLEHFYGRTPPGADNGNGPSETTPALGGVLRPTPAV